MSSPLALIFYESLLAGNQLMNRLQDLGYRVTVVSDLARLSEQADEAKPLVFVTELGGLSERVCAAVRSLRATPETRHVPVLGFFTPTRPKTDRKLAETAQAAGITLVASEKGFMNQLPALLEQVLEV